MIVLALDVATTTGWSLVDTSNQRWPTRCGSFKCAGKEYWQKIASLRDHIERLLGVEGLPDVVAIERPHEARPGQPMNLEPHRLHSAALAEIARHKLPMLAPVPANTWRKAFLGPQPSGSNGLHFKKLCRVKCEGLGMVIRNYDEAEAVGIGHWAAAEMLKERVRREVFGQEVAA